MKQRHRKSHIHTRSARSSWHHYNFFKLPVDAKIVFLDYDYQPQYFKQEWIDQMLQRPVDELCPVDLSPY